MKAINPVSAFTAIAMALSHAAFGACMAPDLQRNYSEADFIFTGTVKDKFETCELLLDDPVHTQCRGRAKIASIEAIDVYKDSSGNINGMKPGDDVLVVVGGDAESPPLANGAQYLLFANYQVGGLLGVMSCGGSESIENAQEELVQLESIRAAFSRVAP